VARSHGEVADRRDRASTSPQRIASRASPSPRVTRWGERRGATVSRSPADAYGHRQNLGLGTAGTPDQWMRGTVTRLSADRGQDPDPGGAD
jgi:hypothetical protein